MTQSKNCEPESAKYQQAMQFLDQRVDFERFQSMPGSERELKLDRMRALLDRLDNPQDKLKIVHVAGTKGKGSTSAMIASILRAAGYRTGLFTSPHLNTVEERIAVDGQSCTTEEFAELVLMVRPVVEAMDADLEKGTQLFSSQHCSGKRAASPFSYSEYGPTYFEILTAMALLHFVRKRVGFAVLEVGLGGRLDSTNVCRPLVSVITSISFDHIHQLGDTLDSIAREKAGIIKPGIPVISGVTAEEACEEIRRIANNSGCQLVELDKDFRYAYHSPKHLEKQANLGSLDFWLLDQKNQQNYKDLPLGLLGRHQAANAAVALATIHELIGQGWKISEPSIRQGLAEVRWPARIEVVSRQPVVILDSAHNAASIAALMEVIEESFTVSRRLLLFATTREKDYADMLKILLPDFDEIVFTQYTTNPRALPPGELDAIAYQLTGRHYPIFPNPADAWKHLRKLVKVDDLICITGSFFLAGEMRKLL